jgi:uncharacterized protein YbjT (DUF2867 family)
MKVLILGATWLVGQNTLVQAVTKPAITQVIAPTKTPLPPSGNLANPVAERLELLLPEVLTWGVDAVICALGTTSGKGEVERDMKLVGFKSLTILRPSIIGGKRDESRFAEGVALTLSRILAPVLPKQFHVNPAAKIAGVLLDSVIGAVPGCHYRYADSLT